MLLKSLLSASAISISAFACSIALRLAIRASLKLSLSVSLTSFCFVASVVLTSFESLAPSDCSFASFSIDLEPAPSSSPDTVALTEPNFSEPSLSSLPAGVASIVPLLLTLVSTSTSSLSPLPNDEVSILPDDKVSILPDDKVSVLFDDEVSMVPSLSALAVALASSVLPLSSALETLTSPA